MKEEIPLFFIGALFGIFSICLILIFVDRSPKQIEQKMQKEAISHGAAYYEVDTNGIVTFKWKNKNEKF
jgi:hypothetical protein